MPGCFVDAWERAAMNVRRRFCIDNQPSQGILSHTRFPEGDPLSVCSMTILNVVTHVWMELRFPRLRFISYVDNLELLGESASEVREGMRKLGQFVNLFDMEVDGPKTFFWSTTSDNRKALRDEEAPTCETARDLGGHMQYVVRRSKREKCLGMTWLWQKLRRSKAPKHHNQQNQKGG